MTGAQTTALAAALSVVAALITFVAADAPVSRQRVHRFAALHDVRVTGENGMQIISYLATTRRYRAAGLVGGLTAYTVIDLQHSRISINLMYLLAGWFVGALIAEARVAGVLTNRRAASLTPRTTERYLSGPATLALPGSVLAFLALTAAAAPMAQAQGAGGRSFVSLVVVTGVASMVWLTTRRVLRRSQPLAAPDVLAADDAIRSRSLHTVTASGATLVLYCACDQLLRLVGAGSPELALVVTLLGAVAVPLSGWRLATSRWVVRPEAMVA